MLVLLIIIFVQRIIVIVRLVASTFIETLYWKILFWTRELILLCLEFLLGVLPVLRRRRILCRFMWIFVQMIIRPSITCSISFLCIMLGSVRETIVAFLFALRTGIIRLLPRCLALFLQVRLNLLKLVLYFKLNVDIFLEIDFFRKRLVAPPGLRN